MCVCDKFLQRDYFQCSGLRVSKFHSLFYFTGCFRFLSVDFTIILKDQSMFSASADEMSLITLLFDNFFFCYHGIRDFRISQGLLNSLLAKEKVSIT